jgi:NADH-quinone oxidoreductase subunit N
MPPGFSSADFVYLLPEIFVSGGAVVILLLDLLLRRPSALAADHSPRLDRALASVTLATLVLACAALVPSAGLQTTAARGLLAVDAFSLYFDVLFVAAAALTVLMSGRYLAIERIHAGEYYVLVLCATLGMMVMAAGIDLITIFVGLETMAVSFYLLAGFIRPNRRSNEAAVKYFVLGAFSLAILLYGMSLLYGLTGSTQLRTIATELSSADRGRMLPLAVMLVAAGIGFKIAAVPFHMWAPDVYEGAPTPITALLSVGSKAASFAMLMRIFIEGLPAFRVDGLGLLSGQPFGWRGLFYVLSIATMTLGNLSALAQTNTKRLLAYSSIAHAGYLLIGVVAGPPRGITAALVYLVAYALMQLGAFSVVVMLRRRDVIGDELEDFTGLSRTHPAMALAMLVFMLSLGGIPATAGFMGKLWLFGAALDAGYVGLAAIGVLNSVLSIYYYSRIVVLMWTPPAVEDGRFESPVRTTPALVTVVAVAAAGTIGFGIYPRFLFEMAAVSAASLGVVK